jgi:hypothetical protein
MDLQQLLLDQQARLIRLMRLHRISLALISFSLAIQILLLILSLC